MIKCFFTNLESIAISELRMAQKSIKAAVAWINFDIYGVIFQELIHRGVKLKILLNDDGNNQRYLYQIQQLNNLGAEIRLINYFGIMHHKFCVIDNRVCMFGSFNWTQNANLKNIEDINICDDVRFVNNYRMEFKALWKLSQSDIRLLRNPPCCTKCREPIVNILLMEQHGYYQTKIDVIQQCGCCQNVVFTDYFDISIYNNYEAAIHSLEDEICEAQQYGDESSYMQIVAQQDFVIANYLSSVRSNRMGFPIIHAVGVKAWDFYDKHNGNFIYKIIWKERGTENYIADEYDIEI